MLMYADVCGRMRTYADVYCRMLTQAHVCCRMRTYSDVGARILTCAHVSAGFALRRHLPCITRGLGVAVKGCCWWAGTELFKSSGGAAYGPRVEVSRAQHSGELTTIGPGEVELLVYQALSY